MITMDNDDIPDFEADNYEELCETFIEEHQDLWDEHVDAAFQSAIEGDADAAYERMREDKWEKSRVAEEESNIAGVAIADQKGDD